jgi:hypothetical protein
MADIPITCPKCGRRGRLPEGWALPAVVRCPACKTPFQPGTSGVPARVEVIRPEDLVIEETPAAPLMIHPQVAQPPTPARTCDFCGEAIQPAAKKCRHCGEILDPVMRASEEARRLATRPAPSPPAQRPEPRQAPTQVIVHNTVVSQSDASASAVAGSFWTRPRSGCGCGCLTLLLLFFLGPLLLGPLRSPRDTSDGGPAVVPRTVTPPDVRPGRPAAVHEAPAVEAPSPADPVSSDDPKPKADVKKAPVSGGAATTALKMARNMERLNPSAAPKFYQDVLSKYPGTTEAAEAAKRIDELARSKRSDGENLP